MCARARAYTRKRIRERATSKRERARARACRCAVHRSSGRAQGKRRAVLGALVGVDVRPVRAPTGKAMRVHPQRAAAISIAGNVVSHAMRPRNAVSRRTAAVSSRQPRVGLLIPACMEERAMIFARTRGRWLREIYAALLLRRGEKYTPAGVHRFSSRYARDCSSDVCRDPPPDRILR